MIPDPLDRAEVQAAAVHDLAAGATGAAIAEALAVSEATVSRFRNDPAVAERIAAQAEALALIAQEEGQRSERFRKAVRARLRDAMAKPGASTSAPQSFRAYCEVARAIGGIRDVTINGDVDASQHVTVDARRVQLVQSGDRAAQRERLAELERDLGIV